MAKDKKYPRHTSPVGVVAGFTSLADADTKFKAEGVFHTKLRFAPSDVQKYIDEAKKLAEAKLAEIIADADGKKAAVLKKSAKVVDTFKADTDEEGEDNGMVVASFKMNHKVNSKKTGKTMTFVPKCFNAVGKEMTRVNPWGGSELKVNFEIVPYFNEKDKEAGCSLRLYAYQVIKLVQGSGGDAGSFGFGEEEGGWEGDDEESTPSDKTSTSDDAEDGDEAQDF